MLATIGADDVFTAFLLAFAAAAGTAAFVVLRRWVRHRIDSAQMWMRDTIHEIIDDRVEPRFAEVRDDLAQQREDLHAHTQEEADIVRGVVREEIAPIVEILGLEH